MVDRHNVDELIGNALGILLLDELRKNALEIGERQRSLEFGGGRIGENLAFRDDDNSVTDDLNYLKHVRDVENRFALRSQLLQKILKEPSRHHIEPGEGFVKDKQLRIVQQSSGD